MSQKIMPSGSPGLREITIAHLTVYKANKTDINGKIAPDVFVNKSVWNAVMVIIIIIIIMPSGV